ncbi:hypothetical protein [Bacillus sp. NPDC094106]|uniref:hypothetical protein n=1 Tax=Bacillus sp. NPDC094106 TaxID=3363949 RepID=UPI003805F038
MITYTQDLNVMQEKTSGDILKSLTYMENRILYFKNDVPIAYGEAEFETDGSVYIQYIKCLKERVGHGTEIISHLKKQEGITEIWGESIPDAVPFWHKMNVTFDKTEFTRFMDEDELEEGFLIPFSLKCGLSNIKERI